MWAVLLSLIINQGAGGIVAFTYVANAKPDGYTLLNHSDYFFLSSTERLL